MKLLNICYLLESTDLCGGVRIVFDQARALTKRGHQVTILARQGNHSWYPYSVQINYVVNFHEVSLLNFDVVIATFWTTLSPAAQMNAKLVVHLCQGCEWTFPEYISLYPDIEFAYKQVPHKITVGNWLNHLIEEKFGQNIFELSCVGQIIDTDLHFLPSWIEQWKKKWSKKPLKVLITGIFESWVKGIPIALEAISKVRSQGIDIEKIRVTSYPLSNHEKSLTFIDYYYQNISVVQMAHLYKTVDILIAPSYDKEGFGLPFAEALACGIPVIASNIPSYLSFDTKADYAYFVPAGNSDKFAEALHQLITNPQLRKALSKRGSEVMRKQFRSESVAQKIEFTLSKWLGK